MSGAETPDLPGLNISLTLLCVFAVMLNIIVILVLSTRFRCHSSVDLFIINLCISDILLGGIALPVRFNNASHSGESFVGGNPVCKMIMFIPLVTISSSITTMVAIALDRFREIVYSTKLLPSKATYVIFGLWAWSIIVSAPQLYEYSVYEKQEAEHNITSCGSHDIIENFETAYACVIIVLVYLVPLMVITISYSRIMIFVWQAGRSIGGAESQVLKKRMKIVKLLISITVVFVLLWSPYFILFGMEEILGLDDTLHIASWPDVTKTVMVVLSTISNPIIYFIADSKFREDLARLVTGKVCSGSIHNQVHPTTTTQRNKDAHAQASSFILVDSATREVKCQSLKESDSR